jgi:Flp pilus assembly pilin Flp
MSYNSTKSPVNQARKLHLARDTRGGGVVEYVILIGCIAILAYAGFKAFGDQVSGQIKGQTTTLKAIPTASP